MIATPSLEGGVELPPVMENVPMSDGREQAAERKLRRKAVVPEIGVLTRTMLGMPQGN
jgi:hypothetical protein